MTSEETFEIEGGLKPLKVTQTSKTTSSGEEILNRVQLVFVVAKAHILYHRNISIGAAIFLFSSLLVALVGSRGRGNYEAKLDHDFSDIKDLYELKKTEIDHWCLGSGNDCACSDPTISLANDEVPGWKKAHKMNKELVREASTGVLDVVFLGDDTIEQWNGRWMGERLTLDTVSLVSSAITDDLYRINRLWNRTFTKAGGGQLDGLALGIYGDTVGNLLWRLEHDEMPASLKAKVWWILVGSNDLVKGGCSEDAVILGILRVAEEIASRDKEAKVVIQGLLPRSSSPDGSLDTPRHRSFFQANSIAWWPSIQLINEELQQFCHKHKNFYYFDASSMLLGQISNEHFTSSTKQIMQPLMPDYVHMSYQGFKIVSAQVVKKLYGLLHIEDGATTKGSGPIGS